MRRKITKTAYKRWLKLKLAKRKKYLEKVRAWQVYLNSLPKKPKPETELERIIRKKREMLKNWDKKGDKYEF